MRALILLAPVLSGCVFVYGATAPAPGLMRPATDPGQGDFAVTAGLVRNVTDGADVTPDGTRVPAAPSAPTWPALDASFRQGFGRGFGLEGRLLGSLSLPVPIPIPNGYSLAPVLLLAEPGEDVRIDLAPRFVNTVGLTFVALGGGVQEAVRTRAWGVEVPVYLTWEPTEAIAVNATPYARAFLVRGRKDVDAARGVSATWPTVSGGITVNGMFDLGPVRLGIGGGVEAVPDPGAGWPCDGCAPRPAWTAAPQALVSVGGAWR